MSATGAGQLKVIMAEGGGCGPIPVSGLDGNNLLIGRPHHLRPSTSTGTES